MKLNESEEILSKATEIDFYQSPPIVALLFPNESDSIEGYYSLLKAFHDTLANPLTLVIRYNELIDISIICTGTADAININGLKYNISNLESFIGLADKDNFILLTFGFRDEENKIVMPVMEEIIADKSKMIYVKGAKILNEKR